MKRQQIAFQANKDILQALNSCAIWSKTCNRGNHTAVLKMPTYITADTARSHIRNGTVSCWLWLMKKALKTHFLKVLWSPYEVAILTNSSRKMTQGRFHEKCLSLTHSFLLETGAYKKFRSLFCEIQSAYRLCGNFYLVFYFTPKTGIRLSYTIYKIPAN